MVILIIILVCIVIWQFFKIQDMEADYIGKISSYKLKEKKISKSMKVLKNNEIIKAKIKAKRKKPDLINIKERGV